MASDRLQRGEVGTSSDVRASPSVRRTASRLLPTAGRPARAKGRSRLRRRTRDKAGVDRGAPRVLTTSDRTMRRPTGSGRRLLLAMRLDPVAGGIDPAIIACLPRLKADFREFCNESRSALNGLRVQVLSVRGNWLCGPDFRCAPGPDLSRIRKSAVPSLPSHHCHARRSGPGSQLAFSIRRDRHDHFRRVGVHLRAEIHARDIER